MADSSENEHDGFLENEIIKIITNLKRLHSHNTSNDIDELLFEHFYKDNSIGNEIANNWFNKKGCLDFCNIMPDILVFIKHHWNIEFNEELADYLLSPHELIKTYVFCKAKEIFNDNI